jgi:hypothetical protein
MKLYKLFIPAFFIYGSSLFGQNVEFDKKNFEDKEGFKVAKNNLEEGDKFYQQGSVFF